MMDEIGEKYLIEEGEGVLGGFSQGGGLAIDAALNQEYLNAKGFISLCPARPEVFTPQGVKRAAARGIKGVIITGEYDQSLPQQKEMLVEFREGGLPCRLVIEDGLGHWFPEDLGEQLDRALDYISD